MTAICATCRTEIGLWAFRMIWCPKCRTFSCKRCREDTWTKCSVCGTERNGRSYSFRVVLFLLFIIGPMAYVTLVFIIDDFSTKILNIPYLTYTTEGIFLVCLFLFLRYRRNVNDRIIKSKKSRNKIPPFWTFTPLEGVVKYHNNITALHVLMARISWTVLGLLILGNLVIGLMSDSIPKSEMIVLITIISPFTGTFMGLTLYTTAYYLFDDEIPTTVLIGQDGFRINFRDGTKLGLRWSDIAYISNPICRISKYSKKKYCSVAISMALTPRRDFTIDFLSETNSKRIFSIYHGMHPGLYVDTTISK